jgi:hypothetical protein
MERPKKSVSFTGLPQITIGREILFPWRKYPPEAPLAKLPPFSERIRGVLHTPKWLLKGMSRIQREDYLIATLERLTWQLQDTAIELDQAKQQLTERGAFKFNHPQDPLAVSIQAVLAALNYPSYACLPPELQKSITYELTRHGFEEPPNPLDL